MATTDDRQRRGAADLLSQIPTDGQRAAPLPDGSQSNPLNTEFGRNAMNTLSALPGVSGGAMGMSGGSIHAGSVATGALSRAAATAAQSAPVASALSSLNSAAKVAGPYTPAVAAGATLLGAANLTDSSTATPRVTSTGSAAAALARIPETPAGYGSYSSGGQIMGPPNLSALNQPESAATSAAAKLSNVTREGNSYSGVNIGGDISINGAVPRGSVTTLPAGAAPSGISGISAAQQLLAGAPSPATSGISAQSMGAADGLDARSQLESLARLRASGQIVAPAAGPSMNLSGGTFGIRRDPGIVASELGAQRAFDRNMGRDPASLQRAAVLQQAQLEQQGANARALLSDMGNTRRTSMEQTGANVRAQLADKGSFQRQLLENQGALDRQVLQSAGAVQAAQIKASQGLSKELQQQTKDASDVMSLVTQADDLLKTATGSYAGAAFDGLARGMGLSTPGADAAAQLKVLQGSLISKMPKMSGPQSDKDVQLYREMAGQIGDATLPASTRQAALEQIYALNAKYASPEALASTQGSPLAQRVQAAQAQRAAAAPVGAPAPAAAPAPASAATAQPTGTTRQVGTSGGRPVYEDEQGRRFLARGG